MERTRSQRGSSRSRGSASTVEIDPKEKLKDCWRKMIAFLFTQVGVGALVIGYSLVGAVVFRKIEIRPGYVDPNVQKVWNIRNATIKLLFEVAVNCNVFENGADFKIGINRVLKDHQDSVALIFRHGYDESPLDEEWTYPAALMFCLSIITMIGYGNMVPRTSMGKVAVTIYAVFGIPLYILYFMNMGKIFAGCFKWIYRRLYECSTEPSPENDPPKRIIVPSTACLWVIGAYVLTGAIMFSEWEKWGFLDSTYFCVTSLCKLGLGDLVPGADVSASNQGSQTKLVINFLYMLLGMGLVAMCYNLMKEEIKVKVKEMQEDFHQCLEDTKVRFVLSCNKIKGTEEEYSDY